MIRALALELSKLPSDFYLAFRRHPRDNVSYEEYDALFKAAGIKTIDTHQFTTHQVSAASDTILTGYSTEGLHGIYRRKPTVHITDKKLQNIPDDLRLPLPPVRLGASVGINTMSELFGALSDISDPASQSSRALRENMEKYYPSDGKNAERVAVIVRDILERK
jgi:hypothetical protein